MNPPSTYHIDKVRQHYLRTAERSLSEIAGEPLNKWNRRPAHITKVKHLVRAIFAEQYDLTELQLGRLELDALGLPEVRKRDAMHNSLLRAQWIDDRTKQAVRNIFNQESPKRINHDE